MSAVRILHLTHHDGCQAEIDFVAGRLGFEVVHQRYDDGYNIGPDRAARSWAAHRDAWSGFEWVMTSDTAPLARIFLQGGYRGKLIIWICNRFDYADQATNDCGFPDAAFFDLFRRAATAPRVALVSYTEFEHHYARTKGVEIGGLTIKPTGAGRVRAAPSLIPSSIDRSQTCFVPAYHNDTILMDLEARCRDLGIAAYGGRYAGPADLHGFRGIVHIPYAWSNFALFENLQEGLPYFVPSAAFLLELAREQHVFWSPPFGRPRRFFWSPPFDASRLALSEWYHPDHAGLFLYFDSWADLQRRARDADLDAVRRRIASFCGVHTETTLGRWRELFHRLA